LEIFNGIRYTLLAVLTRENAGEKHEQAMGEAVLLENVIGTSRSLPNKIAMWHFMRTRFPNMAWFRNIYLAVCRMTQKQHV
jgi:hypothetical protein